MIRRGEERSWYRGSFVSSSVKEMDVTVFNGALTKADNMGLNRVLRECSVRLNECVCVLSNPVMQTQSKPPSQPRYFTLSEVIPDGMQRLPHTVEVHRFG